MDTTTIEIQIVRDGDGRWASRWPSDLVAAGGSAGAGRSDTLRGLVAKIEAKGFEIVDQMGRVLIVRLPVTPTTIRTETP